MRGRAMPVPPLPLPPMLPSPPTATLVLRLASSARVAPPCLLERGGLSTGRIGPERKERVASSVAFRWYSALSCRIWGWVVVVGEKVGFGTVGMVLECFKMRL